MDSYWDSYEDSYFMILINGLLAKAPSTGATFSIPYPLERCKGVNEQAATRDRGQVCGCGWRR